MTPLQAFFLGCMVSLIPSVLLMAFLLWRKNSSRLLIEDQSEMLEDQLAIDLRALIPFIVRGEKLSDAEIAARHHLIAACHRVLVACGANVLRTGGVGPPPASIENGG
jgi:hypothetical protein